jgi:hypothetical protein
VRKKKYILFLNICETWEIKKIMGKMDILKERKRKWGGFFVG